MKADDIYEVDFKPKRKRIKIKIKTKIKNISKFKPKIHADA